MGPVRVRRRVGLVAGRAAVTPNTVTRVQVPQQVGDEKTQRALSALTDAVQDLQSKRAGGVVVTGSRASGDALANLLTALAACGIITDNTST